MYVNLISKTRIWAFISQSSDSVLWEDNAEIRAQLSKKLRPVIVDVDVELESGFVAKARLYVPPNIDDSGFVKYPAVVQV